MRNNVARFTCCFSVTCTLPRAVLPLRLHPHPPNARTRSFSTTVSRRKKPSIRQRLYRASLVNDAPIASTSQPPAESSGYRRLEAYLQAPYPTQLIPIENDLLRKEVFRSTRPAGTPATKELGHAYYHTALEKKGDDLTRLIADEVAIYWCLQFSDDYARAAKFLNKHAYHPVSSLIRNTHWTVLSRQFGVHPIKYEDSDCTNVASRLADNFEAYIYALYLDQGIETVYKFLAPIFLKKLYSQARQLEIPIPTEKIALELQPDGSFKQPGLVSRISKPIKDRLFGKSAEPQIKRIEYAGLPLPDWEVPCVNGKECTRDNCYFDHTGDKLVLQQFPIHWEESRPAEEPLAISSASSGGDTSSALTEEAVTEAGSATVPEGKGQLEKGLFKRLEVIMNNKLERDKKDIMAQAEKLILGRTSELWSERKATRKSSILEVYKTLSEGTDGLPSNIKKALERNVDAQFSKTNEAIKSLLRHNEGVEERLSSLEVDFLMLEKDEKDDSPSHEKDSKIAELEQRLKMLEEQLASVQFRPAPGSLSDALRTHQLGQPTTLPVQQSSSAPAK